MQNRNLTLFQRSVLVNSLLTSQIWYYAQTYPLPLYWSKKINVLLYKFIWIANTEPIARSTLNLDRDMGGLSVINILVKSESIFAYRMLKQFMEDENQLSLVTYFNSLRVNPMLNIRTLPINVAYVNTSYYNKGITTIRKCMRLNSFPNISSRIIYSHLLVKQMPKIQEQYPLYNWKHIWGNLQFKFIPINTREVMFKYLHEILPNKCRLKQIRRSNDDLCETCNVPETNIHMMYYCLDVMIPKRFLIRLLLHCCIGEINLLKFMFLEISKRNKKLKNTIIILIITYISSVWYGRKNRRQIAKIYTSALLSHLKILKKLLGDTITEVFTSEFCELRLETMHNLI